MRTQAWGPLTERRVQLASGLVVEWGFAPRSWADVAPLDDGTARVVADGFAVLYDPFGLLEGLVAAVRGADLSARARRFETQSTVQLEPDRSSAPRSPSPRFAWASVICSAIWLPYSGRSTARNTPIGVGS